MIGGMQIRIGEEQDVVGKDRIHEFVNY